MKRAYRMPQTGNESMTSSRTEVPETAPLLRSVQAATRATRKRIRPKNDAGELDQHDKNAK